MTSSKMSEPVSDVEQMPRVGRGGRVGLELCHRSGSCSSAERRASEFPLEGLGVDAVVPPNEPEDAPLQLFARPEAASANHPSLKNAEPDFDLIHPRGVQGRVHKVEAVAVASIERGPSSARAIAVDVEVVPDDVARLIRRARQDSLPIIC
jgi:hypothetical protein